MLSWENTYKEIEEAGPEVAILPIGAVEQHSFHLPIGCDWLMAQEVAKRVAERIDAFLLPAMPYGNSQEHSDFIGTIWLRPSTLAQVVKDIVASLRYHKIRKVVIINGHGGNWILKPTVREINLEYRDMQVIWTGPGALSRGSMVTSELHSGEGETSRMLHVRPDLVKEARVDYVPEETSEYLDYAGMKGVAEHGVWGRPTLATAEKGQKIIEKAVEAIVAYIERTFEWLDRRKGGR